MLDFARQGGFLFMTNGLTIGLFNDSFPPTIDGVANTAANYARFIQQDHGTAVVATPWYPDTADHYAFDVVRYPSAYISKRLGYRAGYPFDPRVIKRLEGYNIDLIHTHCPFISTVLGRVLRHQTDAPMVFTYHTKFDIDIEKRVALNPVRSASIKFVLSNINACDEVWAVSRGAGENLRSLGFEGDYIIMENGADFPKGRSGKDEIQEIRALHGLKEDLPTFLFVGRMMWYKNIQLILDSLKLVKDAGLQFQMIFAGSGADLSEIQAYTQSLQLEDCCIFPGMIRDRKLLKAYFSTADLFLFPSTYGGLQLPKPSGTRQLRGGRRYRRGNRHINRRNPGKHSPGNYRGLPEFRRAAADWGKCRRKGLPVLGRCRNKSLPPLWERTGKL